MGRPAFHTTRVHDYDECMAILNDTIAASSRDLVTSALPMRYLYLTIAAGGSLINRAV